MNFYRLVKPIWAQPTLFDKDRSKNPNFIRSISGPNIIEGFNFSKEFLREQNQKGYNIYFFPNHPSKNVYSDKITYLSGKLIDTFNYVFVDMDLKDKNYSSKDEFLKRLLDFSLRPSLVVDSGNGIHAYWKVKDLTRESYIYLQLALLDYFKTDESVWTVLQLMRVPQYFNTKKSDNFILSKILEEYSSNNEYFLKDFPEKLLNLKEELKLKAKNHINRLEGRLDLDLRSEVNIDEIPDKFINLMLENKEITRLFRDPKSFGDRSSADMKLTNMLFNKDFNIKEALSVISNTEKALEKGISRLEYALVTVNKVYSDRPKHKFKTVREYLKEDLDKILEPQIFGPKYLDHGVLGEPWRRKEILGLIAGAGVGKTAMALNIIKDIISNNPNNDDVYVFFSLEMSKGQIIKRWIKLVGEESKLTDRLYVLDTQDDAGLPINIGLQEIFEYCSEIMKVTGKHVGSIIIDHFHIISSHIDVKKQPNFGIRSEQGTGYGEVQNLSINALATQLKSLVKSLDTFGIVLSQTTKEKGVGDLPIGKDGAYGASQYEWIMDRIVTIWQPLMRIQNNVDIRYLAFQYAKIREKSNKDKIYEYDPKLLTYDMEYGNLKVTTSNEYSKFIELLPKANEAREASVKKRVDVYSIQIDLESVESNIREVLKV